MPALPATQQPVFFDADTYARSKTMTDTTDSQASLFPLGSGLSLPAPLPQSISPLAALLAELGLDMRAAANGGAAEIAAPPDAAPRGAVSSLYVALRCKSGRTASHGLRVALIVSGWAGELDLPDHEREPIEIAALLHDVGILGVPDEILGKPGNLDPEETRRMDQARRMSAAILRSASADSRVEEIVEHVPAWYDGSRPGYPLRGEAIPLGSRLIAIVEAFDAMITEQVYRPAMSLERAGIELFRSAGTQFDPALVRLFARFPASTLGCFRENVSRRGIPPLAPEIPNSYWALTDCSSCSGDRPEMRFFKDRLLDNMHDAVVFIDASLRILRWNHGAERLTGIAGASICDRLWAPGLLSMRSEKGDAIGADECPVNNAIVSGAHSLRRLSIAARNRDRVSVDSHTIPVADSAGTILGAVLVLHDASPEISLQERCQRLHAKATRDPLTQVANRAEFDRVFEQFVRTHRQQQVACSLIICDLDYFKSINDTFGHQAGDEVIKSLATLLASSCRPGDLVARYGGEEFVLLCADCGNGASARRADQIRGRLAQTPQPSLGGRSVTASFGVTEIQPGDTAETMLRRADRGLLIAKEKGRNTVVQLGAGARTAQSDQEPAAGRLVDGGTAVCLSTSFATPMPPAVVREKLAGFIADHQAQVVDRGEAHLTLVVANSSLPLRRRGDRCIPLVVALRMGADAEPRQRGGESRPAAETRIEVTVRPRSNRDRRRSVVEDAARQLAASLQSYLGAREIPCLRRAPIPWAE
ncbi:MAG: diguanylate cyclase [Pirellulaceae bacterium]|nr:diguanylate cyclase [Thermoguttaceae bacterium]MDI9445507.1 diguanylate cyclase [Planctomycetota bacterium]NLY99564.1 diguanylate cyclase [Pirellulaceae bacterium]